jgi:16S rRNA (cytosine1402-N4)-methyltransferase
MKATEVLEKIGTFDLHIPVLLSEILEAFSVFENTAELRYLDGTFGRGGHFQSLKMMLPQMQTVALDQDPEAVKFALEKFSSLVESGDLRVNHRNFSNFSDLNLGLFDMMLLDLGVSSPQLDEAHRGFSFYHNGPLDMRMNSSQELKASDLINTLSEKELNDLFFKYGEVRKPFRVVRAIVHDRKEKPYENTQELSSLIERVDGWHRKGYHPATNYFMALRLAVNDELGVVERTIPEMIKALKPGGRLAVISFHSLEDRIVKYAFRDSELGRPLNKKVIIPTDEECEKNPRSRSAKLRVFVKDVQDERRESKIY